MFFARTSRLHQARMIRHSFEDVVPEDVLDAFVRAVLNADEPVLLQDEEEEEVDETTVLTARERAKRAVYGPAPWDSGEMIVLPLGTALDHAAYYLARNSATTYGQFFAALPGCWRESIREWASEYAGLDGFDDFWRRRVLGDIEDLDVPPTDEKITRDHAWLEYRNLGPIISRPPMDDDPFDPVYWESWEVECNVGPDRPQTIMTDTVPSSILAGYGSVEASVWDGDMASLPMADERAIAAAYKELGYTLVRDDFLISAACSFTPPADDLMKRLLAEDTFDQQLDELAEELGACFDDEDAYDDTDEDDDDEEEDEAVSDGEAADCDEASDGPREEED